MPACKLSLASLSGKQLAPQGSVDADYMLHFSYVLAALPSHVTLSNAKACLDTHVRCMSDDAFSHMLHKIATPATWKSARCLYI